MKNMSASARVKARALGSSAILLATLAAVPAHAQCAPDPVPAGAQVTCAGDDTNGLRVTVPSPTITVAPGATVRGGSAAAIDLVPGGDAYSSNPSVTVNGTVDGGANPGIRLTRDGSGFFYPYQSQYLSVDVGANASVTGSTGVALVSSGFGYSFRSATISNGGTISGSGGIALLASGSGTGFQSITNRAGGTIGAIVGEMRFLSNAGTIDGGTRSAVAATTTGFVSYTDLTNSGSILSNGRDATLRFANELTLSNSGTIRNAGTGAAIESEVVRMSNAAGGRIASDGTVAIRANRSLSLTNAGTVTGDITVGGGAYFYGSFIDNSAGTITGNVTLGTSDDILVVRYADGALRTGISGTIDGGGGVDTLRVNLTGDATLGASFALPTGFEQLGLNLDAGRTVTLASGFVSPNMVQVSTRGGGTVFNDADLVGARQVVGVGSGSTGSGAAFVNNGSIRSTGNGGTDYAVSWFGAGAFDNRGTVASTGFGVGTSGGLTNSGTIAARSTAVRTNGGSFANSGTIRSAQAYGVVIDNYYYSAGNNYSLTNSGRIEGAIAGLVLGGRFTNSGIIASPDTGVLLGVDATLVNAAGGTISGRRRAIAIQSDNYYGYPYAATVVNAGTIDGDVALPSSGRYFAERGGVLNGNLSLVAGGTLVVELANPGPGPFAGINGSVSADNAALVYRVRSNAAVNVVPGTFGSIGFDLYDNAALSITGLAAPCSLTFAGNGSVDTALDIAAGTGPILILRTPTLATAQETAVQNLSVVSRGTLTLDRRVAGDPTAAVVAGGGSTFTNAGTIAVTDRLSTARVAAIAGGANVVNSGTISLNGGVGISGAVNATNSGRIVQLAGGATATGIANVRQLVNSGTIDVGGPAVLLPDDYSSTSASVTNSGRLASANGPAILGNAPYYSATGVVRNLAGGTIAGGAGGVAILLRNGTVENAGVIDGSVRLGAGDLYYPGNSAYVARGGTLRGDLTFGEGYDLFVETDGQTGVTGRIDGGGGINTYRYRRTASGAVALGTRTATGFTEESVEAVGVNTTLTVSSAQPVASLSLFGDGRIVNLADIAGRVTADPESSPLPLDMQSQGRLTGFENRGSLANGFAGNVGGFVNTGSIGSGTLDYAVVSLNRSGGMSFRNDGAIANFGRTAAVSLRGDWSIGATNTGMIGRGGIELYTDGRFASGPDDPFALVLTNSGTITSREASGSFFDGAVSLTAARTARGGELLVNNSGTIESTAPGGSGVVASVYASGAAAAAHRITIGNAGTIRANGGGQETFGVSYPNTSYVFTTPAAAIVADAAVGVTATIRNYDIGLIEATGTRSTAILSTGAALDLTNLGTIRGTAGTVLADDDLTATWLGTTFLAGAVQGADGNDRIVNSGTITGSIALGAGDDRIENYGRIEGNVFLGAGNDIFLHRAGATQIGTVDAGEGDDGFILDATGGGSVNGDQFVNFERFSQIGNGNVTYAGTFRFNTVGVVGGTVTVAAGQTLTSAGDTAITGSDQAETVLNNGTIAGSVALGGGNDRFVNAGLVAGSVLLGAGDDVFVDQPGSRVSGIIDGGTGNDLYNVVLAGNRSGLGNVRGFERLRIDGAGGLSFTQSEALDEIALNGTALNLTQRGNRVGTILGSDAAEWVAIDGDASVIALQGGDDSLSLGTAIAMGRYDGGSGSDMLTFANGGPVTLNGQATNFEAVMVTGGALTVNGLLASAGPVWFGDNDLSLTIGNGGTLAGAIDLGGGNDTLRLVGDAALAGTVSGGSGTDGVVFDLAGNRTLGEGVLTGFETLATTGSGVLTLGGAHGYDRVSAGTDLTIAAGGRLAARQVAFGAGDQRFTIAGQFAGAVDGGAGTDTISVSGGSAGAPVAFDGIANVEAFAMTGGYATIAGTGTLGNVTLGGGRLVGLAGSTITASQINVGTAATFGSAGTVNGNLTVAGLLSPGASPGTMTVNGNVALLGSSTSLFELTPGASDRLVVNGAVTIQNGATLQLTTSGYIRPGTSFELVTASGGITGSYTNVSKPSSLFGYLLQQGNRIALIGQFRPDAGFTPQVARSVDYANRTLLRQGDNSALGNALPLLQTAAGDPDPRRFALLTPEAYASATQVGIDNGLTLVQATRGPAFASTRPEGGAYLFAQTVGQWHRLGADPAQGVNKAQGQGYGYLGGIGYGDGNGMVGMFAGWLDTRQFIATLGTRTRADGIVVGALARYQTPEGFGLASSIAYNDAQARTDRFVPGANGAMLGEYDLTTWTADTSVYYAAPIGTGWSLTPRAGATYVRVTRDATRESGSAAFALTVARDRHLASFIDAGIGFGRSDTSDAALRPFVSLGVRYQFEGVRANALGGYAGGGLGLLALSAARAPVVGTASGGVTYRYGQRLELFTIATAQTGRDDHQESLVSGARLRF